MVLKEWLQRAGFSHGNPFALTEADKEDDLPAYVVGHRALNDMLDDERQPVSSILHAPRGSGKSTMRRMFEAHYRRPELAGRALIVSLTNWMPVVERRGERGFEGAEPHYDLLVAELVLALAADASAPPADPPASRLGYLAALYAGLSPTLTVDEREGLERRFPSLAELAHEVDRYDLGGMPVVRRLRVLAELIRALGYRVCYVLIDRIDELLDTVADDEAGATLLEPLLGNLALLEIPHLAFKAFVPSDVVAELDRRGRLRTDRITCTSMVWESEDLGELLRSRLAFYSDDHLTYLAQVAVPDARDVDAALVQAAQGSPRRLLNLGDALLRACAEEADPRAWQIASHHLARVLGAPAPLPVAPAAASPPLAGRPLPPLRIVGGRLWFGDTEHLGWQGLPDLQRRLLEYLYRRRGEICRKEEIMQELWRDFTPADDGSLRKLGERLIAAVEPNPEQPQYIRKMRGGHFRLDNAAE